MKCCASDLKEVVAEQALELPPSARGFYGILNSLRQRIRSHEQAHGPDGYPHVQSPISMPAANVPFFDRDFRTPFDCQAISSILPAPLDCANYAQR